VWNKQQAVQTTDRTQIKHLKHFGFKQYKVYADICWGSLERGCHSGVVSCIMWIFRAFRLYVFGTLGNEANIIV